MPTPPEPLSRALDAVQRALANAPEKVPASFLETVAQTAEINRIVGHLIEEHGATLSGDLQQERIDMAGISAQSTFGTRRMLRNWILKAERALQSNARAA